MADPVEGTAVIARFGEKVDRGALARRRRYFDGNATKGLTKLGRL
jgi:hypothetical protein